MHQRWYNHARDLRRRKHHSILLQRAWDKYGETAFVFGVLELCDPADCVAREQFHIDSLQSSNPNHGFNICPRAGSSLGIKHTPETCQKNRMARLGRKLAPEHVAKMRLALKGIKKTPEHNRKNSEGLKGKKKTPEHRAALTQAFRALWARKKQARFESEIETLGVALAHERYVKRERRQATNAASRNRRKAQIQSP
jgi:group I intron endonuclease